jgi:branched-chain amino acid transport system substrate-binding protein
MPYANLLPPASRRTRRVLALLACALAATLPSIAAQRASGDEIVIGTHLDLTGPLASWGKEVRNGMQMALAEANAAGGVGGRKLRLVVKDDGYDPKQAAKAVRQLIQDEGVFAVVSPLGTPTVQAAAREAARRNALYLFPVTSGDEDSLGTSKLLFTLTPSSKDAVADGVGRLLDLKRGAKVGLLTSDDAYGWGVRTGTEDELSRHGLRPAAAVTFKPGSDARRGLRQLFRDRDRPTLVVLGMAPDDAMEVMRAAQLMGWQPSFFCPACYTPQFATLGGRAVEGVYAVGQLPIPYPDAPGLKNFAARYSEKYHGAASVQALAGYRNVRLFVSALRRSGRTPTQEAFVQVLENQGPWTEPDLKLPAVNFSPEDHLGIRSSFLARAKKGRWSIVLEESLRPALRASR